MRILKFKGVRDLAKRWKGAYYSSHRGWSFKHHETTYRMLQDLPADATQEEAYAIIGHVAWTRYTCNECGKSVDKVFEVGEEPDYESSTAHLCVECVNDLIALASRK